MVDQLCAVDFLGREDSPENHAPEIVGQDHADHIPAYEIPYTAFGPSGLCPQLLPGEGARV